MNEIQEMLQTRTLCSRLNVTVNDEGRIAPLQRYRQTLEKVFDFQGWVLSPSTGVLTTQFFEERERVGTPTTKSLDNKGLKEDALRATMVEVGPVFGAFAGLDGVAGMFRCLE